MNTGEIAWDNSIEDPATVKAAITGETSTAAKEAAKNDWDEWTVDDLKSGKPLLVYRYLDGLTADQIRELDLPKGAEESLKFSQAFEVKVLSKDDVIARINEAWRAKKSPIDPESDTSKPENQASITFYAFTGQKLGSMDVKDSISSRAFGTALKRYEAKNRALCDQEIKRLEEQEKAREEAEATAGK